ncbi:MAG: PDZ domain-containing protein [Candidatus Binatia bacterium]|nr:PDZ domain-containing protein [Candidatus Binatia bacterium]
MTNEPQAVFQAARFHVLFLNGGGTKEQNYQSHLLHLTHMAALLRAAGVPVENFTILSGDGEDAAADLAVRPRSRLGKRFWLVEHSPGAAWLRPPLKFENSTLAPFPLLPATRGVLASWFAQAKSRLKPGDTLFLFVTDHGTKNEENPDNNFIVLWGKDARLSVEDLQALIAQLDPEVRVVMVMSQCFSGSFARLMLTNGNEPAGNVCGYFSSTKERPAYGCYPENMGRNNIGHAFQLMHAWSRVGNLIEAHEIALVSDDTPDVPLRTSELYLESILRKRAAAKGVAVDSLVDELLAQAWRDKAKWESKLRLLDRIGQAYGMFSPRSLAELSERTAALPDLAEQLQNVSRAWRGAWQDASTANWERFLEHQGEWRTRLAAMDPAKLSVTDREALARELLPALEAFTRERSDVWTRLSRLRANSRDAQAASYRMEVRQGVLLRMRSVLVQVAGLHYLDTEGSPGEQRAYGALVACEEVVLPKGNLPQPGVRVAAQFPQFMEDARRARASLPAWMGIQFRAPNEEMIRRKGLPAGAAAVITVYPNSPAETAGLQQGDIVLGPPGQPFTERGQVRSWIMLSKPGETLELEILRGNERKTIQLVAGTYPLRWPTLPGPPQVGSVAPPLEVETYRGQVPRQLSGGQAHVLFFWATWCAACKASLAELTEFAAARGIRVVAITDEPRAQLDRFFQTYRGPFPEDVAIDEYRKAFVAYGVSGTPTFVLVSGDGRVSAVRVGYDAKRGLGLE